MKHTDQRLPCRFKINLRHTVHHAYLCMQKMRVLCHPKVRLAGLSIAMVCSLSSCVYDEYLSFLNPHGPIAEAERTHFLWVLAILAIFVALPIFILTPWLAWRYRYNARKSSYQPKWKANRVLEILTWGGPIVIVIILGFLLWANAHKLDPYQAISSDKAAIRIQAISYDWKWLFIYPDLGIASMGSMPIPEGHPIAMQLTSATVMQSLQIPALVGQIYTMGGMITKLHFRADDTGRFLGENTMYNGRGFHQQKFVAKSMPMDQFKQWVKTTRHTGLALNERAYQNILAPNTRKELAKKLNQEGLPDDAIYFKDVNPKLFTYVVDTTKKGHSNTDKPFIQPEGISENAHGDH